MSLFVFIGSGFLLFFIRQLDGRRHT
ncbi:hypothetical protein MUS_1928 [Bacillus velezensis YAU B9601-Y2]|uniref:Uncharacterized protein n=1 Tax=Bacillus amyloliquefaciens (strain Y2) TaxID=1155777 RepID=I2C5I4_BACAY|nr:hypothetical protein MUS_1928 [Bacillus velezensis YAU B9601-Y2]